MNDYTPASSPSPAPAPVQPTERMLSLDVIRGIAILGILLVNMAFFNTPHQYNGSVRAQLIQTDLDQLARWFIDIFAAGKFYTLFSFLFGLGMFIFLDRAEQKGHRAVPLFLRRLLVLLGLGAVHAFLIWYGDILMEYAVLGFLLILFRRLSPGLLVLASVGVFLLQQLLVSSEIYKMTYEMWRVLNLEMFFSNSTMMRQSIAAYAHGGYLDTVVQRFYDVLYHQSWFWANFPAYFTMFLLGVAAGKKGVFHHPERNQKLIFGVWLFTLVLVVLSTIAERSGAAAFDFWSRLFIRVNDPAGAILYASSLLLLLRFRAVQTLLRPLSYVGRMAVSCYILTSLICTTIFYNYGLGLFNQVSPGEGLLLTFAIYGFLVLFSNLWLRRFRFGPVEWLWRSLTYGKRQPMRIHKKATGSP